jgi:hypothetical protein
MVLAMNWRGCALYLCLLASPAIAGGVAEGPLPQSRPVVVELFTSQGCSDCPAADRIVAELAKRKDVIALSLPITYWDMLGWKDTLATDANTRRQRAYAKFMNRSGVYTPQMIVDGMLDVIGNQHERVMAAISQRGEHMPSDDAADVSVGLASGRVEISIGPSHAKLKPLATIWVMRTIALTAVAVKQGENKNQMLTYANVVRDLQRAGEWTGEAMKIDLPVSLGPAKQDGVAVVLQSHDYGEVLGAALMPVQSNYVVVPPH